MVMAFTDVFEGSANETWKKTVEYWDRACSAQLKPYLLNYRRPLWAVFVVIVSLDFEIVNISLHPLISQL